MSNDSPQNASYSRAKSRLMPLRTFKVVYMCAMLTTLTQLVKSSFSISTYGFGLNLTSIPNSDITIKVFCFFVTLSVAYFVFACYLSMEVFEERSLSLKSGISYRKIQIVFAFEWCIRVMLTGLVTIKFREPDSYENWLLLSCVIIILMVLWRFSLKFAFDSKFTNIIWVGVACAIVIATTIVVRMPEIVEGWSIAVATAIVCTGFVIVGIGTYIMKDVGLGDIKHILTPKHDSKKSKLHGYT